MPDITVAPAKARGYVRVTPEMEADIITTYARTGSYEVTAAECGVDERKVRYIIHDRPRLGRGAAAQKQRTLAIVRDKGPFPDLLSLKQALPFPCSLHTLEAILNSLRDAQLIEYGETNGPISAFGPAPARGTSPSTNAEEVGTTGTGPKGIAPTDEGLAPTYPELLRLTRMVRGTGVGQALAAKYRSAADSLADLDHIEAERLRRKAADLDPMLSDVEAEYLRYAEEHP